MPELPDVAVYVRCLNDRLRGRVLESVRVASPFLVRTYEPPIRELEGRRVEAISRLGKRIIWRFEDDLFLVMHLMIAGRLRWKKRGAKVGPRGPLAAFDFEEGTLVFTEAGSKKRASIHVLRGEAGLAEFDRGGLEVLDADVGAFREALERESHTIKRSLTDPRLFSGIGNAYSDEILHRARLSPFKRSTKLSDAEVERLFHACRETLRTWVDRLDAEVGDGFPDRVTAFRPEMAVHGRHRKACPDCGAPVQRIVYADNECNYCPGCQTDGKILADRSLSRLLRDDWPRSLAELEETATPGKTTTD